MASQTVSLVRSDGQPWGFRLQGGKDWMLPLSVSKVNAGSVAEKAGLKIGDYITKIFDKLTDELLHSEAYSAIASAGNTLTLCVVKGSSAPAAPAPVQAAPTPVPAPKAAATAASPARPTSSWYPQTTPSPSGPPAVAPRNPRPVSGFFEQMSPVQMPNVTTNVQLVPGPQAGSKFNAKPKGFNTFGTTAVNVPAVVHKQFNSPLNLYSMQNIAETLAAHSENLAPGVMGINFMKPDAPVNTHSAVFQAILEEEARAKGEHFSPSPDPGHGQQYPGGPSHHESTSPRTGGQQQQQQSEHQGSYFPSHPQPNPPMVAQHEPTALEHLRSQRPASSTFRSGMFRRIQQDVAHVEAGQGPRNGSESPGTSSPQPMMRHGFPAHSMHSTVWQPRAFPHQRQGPPPPPPPKPQMQSQLSQPMNQPLVVTMSHMNQGNCHAGATSPHTPLSGERVLPFHTAPSVIKHVEAPCRSPLVQ
ncbi:PDZ and LIM domain protein Zasp [Halotydeus destructor]|nr:PDZ and LIM domain protein Zasp [Halotydeus destructor]